MSDQNPGSTGPNNPIQDKIPHSGNIPPEQGGEQPVFRFTRPDGTEMTAQEALDAGLLKPTAPTYIGEHTDPTYDRADNYEPLEKKKRKKGLLVGATATLAAIAAAVTGAKVLAHDDGSTGTTPGPQPTGVATAPVTPGASTAPSTPANPESSYLNEGKETKERITAELTALSSQPITFELVKPLLTSQDVVDAVAKKYGINYNDQLVEPNVSTLYPQETTEAMNTETLAGSQQQLNKIFKNATHMEELSNGTFDATKLYVTPEEFAQAANDPAAKDRLLQKIINSTGEYVHLAAYAHAKGSESDFDTLISASRIIPHYVGEASNIATFYGTGELAAEFVPDTVIVGEGDPSKPVALGSIERGASVNSSSPEEEELDGVTRPKMTTMTLVANVNVNNVTDGTPRYADHSAETLFLTYVFPDVSEGTGVEGAAAPVLVASYHANTQK